MSTHRSTLSATGRPRLFAMVTTLTSRDYTPYALQTFFETTPLRDIDSVVLISNDDPDAASLIPPNAHSLELQINPAPRGFAANANQMIAQALTRKSDLFFMNNDIIYADDWLPPLLGNDRAILSPLSNREVQYAGSAVVVSSQHVATTMILKAPMDLSEYLASPRMFQALAEAHHKTASDGYLPMLVFPFFCVKLPLPILEAVGKFDEIFGRAGGEDYDYALRAWLAGFEVKFALGSYVLHFWGKSTWTAKEGSPRPSTYDTSFLQIFEEKWGSSLYRYTLQENDSEVAANPELVEIRKSGNLATLVSRLMKQPVPLRIP
jgi:GT2 family glycosyltransferase